MEKMDLLGGSTKSREGSAEIPGMVSIYLVRFDSGHYYVDEPKEGRTDPQTTQYWYAAKFMFLMTGRLKAEKIAEKYGGEVYIVNCTKAAPYKESHPMTAPMQSTTSLAPELPHNLRTDIALELDRYSHAYLYCSELSDKTFLFTRACNAMSEFIARYRDAPFWREIFAQAQLGPESNEVTAGLIDCVVRLLVTNCVIPMFQQCQRATGSSECRYLFERQITWLEQERKTAQSRVQAYNSEIKVPELFPEFATYHKSEVRGLITALT